MKKVKENNNENKYFKMLYFIFTASSLGFAVRVFMSTIYRGEDIVMGVIACAVFVALAVFYAYASFLKKDGKLLITKFYRLQYASLTLLLIQIVLTVTDIV